MQTLESRSAFRRLLGLLMALLLSSPGAASGQVAPSPDYEGLSEVSATSRPAGAGSKLPFLLAERSRIETAILVHAGSKFPVRMLTAGSGPDATEAQLEADVVNLLVAAFKLRVLLPVSPPACLADFGRERPAGWNPEAAALRSMDQWLTWLDYRLEQSGRLPREEGKDEAAREHLELTATRRYVVEARAAALAGMRQN